jgi:hypothetical protein
LAVGVGDCVPVPDTVRVRVPVCDGVAVLVGERVALAVTVAVPVIDSADDMVCVVVCDDVAAAVELAVLEMDREPENDTDTVRVNVRTDVALLLLVCVGVGLALGARASTPVASVRRRPVRRQLSMAPPPPYRPATLLAAMRLGENSDAPRPAKPPPSMPAEQLAMVTRCASMSADMAKRPPPLALAELPTMAVSRSETTAWHDAVDARAKSRLPPLPP